MDDAPTSKHLNDPNWRNPLFTKDQPGARRAYKKRVTLSYPQQRQVEDRLRELLTVLGDPADKLCKYAPGFNDIRVADEMPFDCTSSCVETVRRAVFGKMHVKQPEPATPKNEVAVLRAEVATLSADRAALRSDVDALTVRLNRLASALGEPA